MSGVPMIELIAPAIALLKELRDTTPIVMQRKRIDAFLSTITPLLEPSASTYAEPELTGAEGGGAPQPFLGSIKFEEMMTCPFCAESGYDEQGLKSHLTNDCEVFDAIPGTNQLGSTVRESEQPNERTRPMGLLKLLGYINAMVGYCQSLKPGTVINDGYMQRMNDHYIPNTLKAAELIAKMVDAASAPKREAGWLPMDDEAKQGQTVIIAGYVHGVWTVIQDDWHSDREMSDWREWPGVFVGEPTHYIPMPTPPAEDTTQIEGGQS